MEKVTKPRYAKNGDEAIFSQLRHDVSFLVQQLEPERRGSILLKAVFFPAMYLFIYTAILLAGNQPGIFYPGYFLLGVFLVMIFLMFKLLCSRNSEGTIGLEYIYLIYKMQTFQSDILIFLPE